MLERISRAENVVEWRLPAKSLTLPRQGSRNSENKLEVLTTRFRNALKKSVEGIIEAGRVLIEAKNELEHGQFSDWVVRELRLGTYKPGKPKADLRKAEMLMFLARNEVISNPCHWHAFPPSPRTLWELTQIRPKQRLLELIANGTINSAMTREEAVALRHNAAREPSPTPKLKREVVALLDACILLGGGDVVLAHIRELKELVDAPTAKETDTAARWAKQKLADRRRRAE
jgi:hypothetical protein